MRSIARGLDAALGRVRDHLERAPGVARAGEGTDIVVDRAGRGSCVRAAAAALDRNLRRVPRPDWM